MQTNEPPLLLMSHGNSMDEYLIYSLPENRTLVLSIPILHNKIILGSSYGWWVLVDLDSVPQPEPEPDAEPEPDSYNSCLWNPISMDVIELPMLKLAPFYKNCILSKPPTEPDCYVLFSTTREQSFCRIGDDEFVTVPTTYRGKECSLIAIGSDRGQVYGFLDPVHEFVCFRFLGKILGFRTIWMNYNRIRRRWWSRAHYMIWLIDGGDGGGESLLVEGTYSCTYLDDDGMDFRVYQIDINRRKCIELDSIGERTIFVSRKSSSGYCCRSTCSSSSSSTGIGGGRMLLKANSIYYTNRCGRNLNVYDMDDISTTSLLPSSAPRYESTISWVSCDIVNLMKIVTQ